MRITFNWGTGIALTYTAFAVATTGFVAFAMGRPVDLVSPDYYARSLRQDDRMLAVQNAGRLQPAPSIVQSGPRQILLTLPADHASTARGTVTLYRASDARADRVVSMALDASGRQRVSLEDLAAGHWMLQLNWSAGQRDYYLEQPVVVR
jgi:hypothetical protein